MRWILLLGYSALVAGLVYAFFRAFLRERDPSTLPLVAAVLVFSLVVGLSTYSFWWLDTQVNRGVPE